MSQQPKETEADAVHVVFSELILNVRARLASEPAGLQNNVIHDIQQARAELAQRARQCSGVLLSLEAEQAAVQQNVDEAKETLTQLSRDIEQKTKEIKTLTKLGEKGSVATISELSSYIKGYHDAGNGDAVTGEIAKQLKRARQMVALEKSQLG